MLWAWTLAAAGFFAVAGWMISLPLRDASIVDRLWGLSFLLLGGVAAWQGGHNLWLLAVLAVWGIRLSWHIHRRNRGRAEDPRYAAWRQQHGAAWPLRSLFTVFFLQGFLLWIIATPLWLLVGAGPEVPLAWAVASASVVLVSVLLEATADSQLRRWHVSGTIMDRGLWKYSRHPNYFFEALVWWGVWLAALAVGLWWTVFSPLLITFLLRFVSGVPMLEKKMVDRPGWDEYARRTNAFVPWFQRK